jgi:hypothetical protein
MKRHLMLLVVFLIFALLSCSMKETRYKIENVTRIFMHETNNFTFFVEKPGSSEIEEIHISYARNKKLTDVPANKPMWVDVYKSSTSCGDEGYYLEIHIHRVEDINPAGWNHGKFGKGQTTVVE